MIQRTRKYTGIIVFLLMIYDQGYSQNFLYSKYQDLDGESVTVDEIKGENLTVLDFWATWCKPCIKSIPENIKLAETYENMGVAFIGVNVDSPRNLAKVRPFANSFGINYRVLLDTDQAIMTELVVTALPTLIILDNEGNSVYTHEGFIPGDEKIISAKIDELLEDAN